MNWNDLESAWQQQALASPTPSDVAAIVRECSDRQKKMDQFLFWSDLRGSLVSLGLSIYFARLAWKLGSGSWPLGAAAGILLALGGFIAAEQIRTRRSRVSPAASMTARLENDLETLRRRRWLLRFVTFWFLMPMLACVALILAAADKKHPGVFSSAELPRLLAWGAAMLFAVGITWFINQHYARTRVEPQIAALERLRNGLLSKNP